jgi:hypothetical protein
VRLVGPSSVDEMVLAFLRAEVDAPRYGIYFVNVDRRLIDQADLTAPAQNRARRELMAYRHGFYDRVPADTEWQRWALTPAELGDVLYAGDVLTWHRMSGGTRRVRDGAANASSLVIVTELGVDVSAGIRATAEAIDEGHHMAELIAVAKDPDARRPVLMEGHNRATAYLVARRPPAEVIVLVGWSRTMDTTWQPWF